MAIDTCASYNWEVGQLPEVALPTPAWADRMTDTIMVDHCIADTVRAIWAAGLHTLSSCCGHDRDKPSLVLTGDGEADAVRKVIAEVDGREFRLYEWKLTEV